MPGLDSEGLDFRAASESFAPVRKLARRDLETLRLVTGHQGREVPTVGGMILFGQDRERHFPDAWIQAGRFAGTDKSRIIDRAEPRCVWLTRGASGKLRRPSTKLIERSRGASDGLLRDLAGARRRDA